MIQKYDPIFQEDFRKYSERIELHHGPDVKWWPRWKKRSRVEIYCRRNGQVRTETKLNALKTVIENEKVHILNHVI